MEFLTSDPHSALVEETMTLLGPAAQEKQIDLHAEVGASVPSWVRGDARLLRQIVLHLLNNAVKFTERGTIHVRAMIAAQTATSFLRF